MMISEKWRKMAEIYKGFANYKHLDFSEEAAQQMYDFESQGKGKIVADIFSHTKNGYYWGKRNLNITVSSWIEDIKIGLLFKKELYDDWFPNWWLDKVIGWVKQGHPDYEGMEYMKRIHGETK